jgi:hypothetical protein
MAVNMLIMILAVVTLLVFQMVSVVYWQPSIRPHGITTKKTTTNILHVKVKGNNVLMPNNEQHQEYAWRSGAIASCIIMHTN